MINRIFYIILVILVVFMTGCMKDTGPVVISVDKTPVRVNNYTNAPTDTPTQSPLITNTPAPTPTVEEESYVYIEALEYDEGDSTLYYGNWSFGSKTVPFTIGLKTYEKGIGMYVKSRHIKEEPGSVDFTWKLDKNYNMISFDMGCEKTKQYDVEEMYGTYSIAIYIDGEQIWDSGFHDYKYADADVKVDIPEGADSITVELTQTKGINGTLNVILADFKIYYN